MRQSLLLLFLAVVIPFLSSISFAQDNFDLPIKTKCNEQWTVSQGVFLCNQKQSQSLFLKIKIPPTKGSFRVVNCNRDLTNDGNPDDFDSQIWKEGWWIFSRTVRVFAETPQITVPVEETRKDDCPIVITQYADYAGGHSAVLYSAEDKRLADILEYSCAGRAFIPTGGVSGAGMGSCRAITGAELQIRFIAKEPTVLILSGSKCHVFEKHELKAQEQSLSKIKVSKGVCPVTVEAKSLNSVQRSVFMVVGYPREEFSIDSPFLFAEGSKRRAVCPMTATMLSVEVYNGEKIIWRSGRKESTFEFETKDFPANSIACLTAYAEDSNSMSGSCFELGSMKELPYNFF